MSTRPSVFLSSTCFDLEQVRRDLVEFIEGLGYAALASDHRSFPVDPDVDTVENCTRRVEHDASILVLLIGGRYGQRPHGSSKSITNIEYLTARRVGIPVLAFVKTDILRLVPVWERNPTADFSHDVDDTAVFEFIKDVRVTSGKWCFEFSSAQDVIQTLRTQFAFLQVRALEMQRKLSGRDEELSALSGLALACAIDQLPGWQGRLFAHLLDVEVGQRVALRRAYGHEISIGAGEAVDDLGLASWFRGKTDEALRLFAGTQAAVNVAMNQAFAAEDARDVQYAAEEAGRLYGEALEWAQRIRRTTVPDRCTRLRDELARSTKNLIEEIEALSARLVAQIDDALASEEEEARISLKFVLSMHNEELLNQELEKCRGPSDSSLG